jgi:hypothetical protein
MMGFVIALHKKRVAQAGRLQPQEDHSSANGNHQSGNLGCVRKVASPLLARFAFLGG